MKFAILAQLSCLVLFLVPSNALASGNMVWSCDVQVDVLAIHSEEKVIGNARRKFFEDLKAAKFDKFPKTELNGQLVYEGPDGIVNVEDYGKIKSKDLSDYSEDSYKFTISVIPRAIEDRYDFHDDRQKVSCVTIKIDEKVEWTVFAYTNKMRNELKRAVESKSSVKIYYTGCNNYGCKDEWRLE